MPLIALLGIILAAVALVLLAWWIERATRRPGLAFVIVGVLMILAAVPSFMDGKRLLPSVFVVQAIFFFSFARWRGTPK